MPISWNEIRHNAIKFSRDWTGATSERAEKQTFWNEFFQAFGIKRRVILKDAIEIFGSGRVRSDSAGVVNLLRGVQTSGKIAESIAMDPQTPECPLCHSTMVLRTPRHGNNAGQTFWGCSNFPPCRGKRAV
jgi:topoisomerase-like DNA binding C4 zinc finger protein/restriction-modification enzyme MmeI-like protein